MELQRGLRQLVLTVILVCASIPSAATAQQRSATAVVTIQGLDFGQMQPGVRQAISVQDGWRRAVLRLDGAGQVAVRFTLPTQMVSSTGALLPLRFGSVDGEIETSQGGRLTLFDPNVGTRVNLTAAGGLAWIYLGGIATPAPLQRAGTYTATIVIVIAPPNL